MRLNTRFSEVYNFDVQTHLSCAEFLKDSPDVTCLIVDFQMPGLNGFDFLAELRQRGSKVPTIMITVPAALGIEWLAWSSA
jgi:FixJ family two-component response regulator